MDIFFTTLADWIHRGRIASIRRLDTSARMGTNQNYLFDNR